MAKTFQKKKDFKGGGKTAWKDRSTKSDDVILPSVLFSWKQPKPGDVSPWLSLWPSQESFSHYVDPFLGAGLGWIQAGANAITLSVNDKDDEYISAMRLISRGEANAINNLKQWSRLWGVIDAWSAEYVGRWHAFHIEHMRHHALEADVILKRMGTSVESTCGQIFSMQSKEFPHQPLFFRQAITASLIASMRRCHQLAIKNGSPLPPETLINELDQAIRMGTLLYIQKLYKDSVKVGSFIDPYHVMVYVILHSIAQKEDNGTWKLLPHTDFLSYEKNFKPFDSPLVHTLGRQTTFTSNNVNTFLRGTPSSQDTFTFSLCPNDYSKDAFELIYDSIWQKKGLFLIVAPEDITNGIRHLGAQKKWRNKKEINMIAWTNYSASGTEISNDNADSVISDIENTMHEEASDQMPDFSSDFGDESPPDF